MKTPIFVSSFFMNSVNPDCKQHRYYHPKKNLYCLHPADWDAPLVPNLYSGVNNKKTCNKIDCGRTRKLVFCSPYWVCQQHYESLDDDAKTIAITIPPKRLRRMQKQFPKGHTPSFPYKRLPILEYETAVAPGGPSILKPIRECLLPFSKNNLLCKKNE